MKIRPGVTFHDGEKLDAAAVKFNLERHKTMQGSNRRGELAPLASVDVVDPMTVKLNLSAPFSPLLAALADRAGMMVSPKAAQAAGANFGSQAGVLGAVQVRGARGAGPHRARALRRLLEQGQRALRQDHLHADRRCHRAAGQPQVGPVRLHRARGVERHREAAGREEVQGHAHHRDRLPGHHDQRGQERASARRPRSARTRACARPSSWPSTARAWRRW